MLPTHLHTYLLRDLKVGDEAMRRSVDPHKCHHLAVGGVTRGHRGVTRSSRGVSGKVRDLSEEADAG
jgi:hypothetical protein